MDAFEDMNALSPVEAVAPSEAIVTRVAATEDVDPTDLPPLYEAIDPERLDALIEHADTSGTTFELTFTYYGYDVTVTDESTVYIDDATPEQVTAV